MPSLFTFLDIDTEGFFGDSSEMAKESKCIVCASHFPSLAKLAVNERNSSNMARAFAM